MKLTALIEPTSTGYSGHVIELDGQVIAVGDSVDEVAQLLREAAEDIVRDNIKLTGHAFPPSKVILDLEIS
jgi:predicted RNase H-like HicB family nuclease